MILKSELAKTIANQRQRLKTLDSYPRKMLSQIHLLPDFVLVVSGIRRSGKSTLLAQLIDNQQENDYLFLNFDTPQLFNFEFNDFALLDEIMQENTALSTLYFDEIQVIEGWEVYVRGKLDQGYQVVVTGSNASLLSRELGTKLTGRHISRELFPFSFVEFCEYLELEKNSQSVNDYLTLGGFPQYLHWRDEEILTSLLNDILYRDIVVRFGIRDEQSMKRLVLFLAGNVGNLISANKLKQSLEVKSTSTVQEYLNYLEQAYLIQLVPKFSYSYKSQLVNPRKVYFIDNGLQQAISPSFTQDNGRKLENAVFGELRRQYQEIYYYNENNKECDFVVCQNNQPILLLQVCWQLTTENQEREQNGLLDAMVYFNMDRAVIISFEQQDKILIGEKVIDIVPFGTFFTGN
ncbi:ATP-binding protein [Lonepinella sp. MS14437]|uniref:ATP-binding protein n=1 Tax=unclassified Lonepinella TaxID=2642006 RepID=UPI0036DB5DD4